MCFRLTFWGPGTIGPVLSMYALWWHYWHVASTDQSKLHVKGWRSCYFVWSQTWKHKCHLTFVKSVWKCVFVLSRRTKPKLSLNKQIIYQEVSPSWIHLLHVVLNSKLVLTLTIHWPSSPNQPPLTGRTLEQDLLQQSACRSWTGSWIHSRSSGR